DTPCEQNWSIRSSRRSSRARRFSWTGISNSSLSTSCSAPRNSDQCIIGVGAPEEAHWNEDTAAIPTGVQGEGRPGGADGGAVAAETCRKPTLSPNLLGIWKATFLERAHTLFQPDEQREDDQARIAELKQLLGRATRQIEIPMFWDPQSSIHQSSSISHQSF